MTLRGALTLLGDFASVHDFLSPVEERLTYESDPDSGGQSLSRNCPDKASPGSKS